MLPVQTNTSVAAICRFFFILFPISCAIIMSMGAIATHFLGIFTVCKFAFVYLVFFIESSVFYDEI